MKNSSKLLFSLSLIWATLLLAIGTWWLYLISHFEEILYHKDHHRVMKMLTWEGGTFIFLLILISMTLFFLYIKDLKKTKALQDFFSSLTHELKTPLASIKLQGEVLSEIIASKNDPQLQKLLARLISDTGKLEGQMDKLLQLSRMERGGNLNLVSVNLVPFLKNMIKGLPIDKDINITIDSSNENLAIIADEFALELIIKNLFENSRIHSQSKKIHIKINTDDKNVIFQYNDGAKFNGDPKKLGTLFYKHNSKKGSGIGLYLINKLLCKMEGSLIIETVPHLIFNLTFKKSEELHA
jgi:signal transduction histidine kinase